MRQGETPSNEKAKVRHGLPCLSVKEMRAENVGRLTQMWVNLPHVSQTGHPQILPSKSIGSGVLSRDQSCVKLRGFFTAMTVIIRIRDATGPY